MTGAPNYSAISGPAPSLEGGVRGEAPLMSLRRRSAVNNVETIKGIYQSFGRGDVAAILEQMSPEVDWDYGQSVDVPWLRPGRGRDAVQKFFAAVGEYLDFRSFVPKDVFASPDGKIVVALVDVEVIIKTTGRTV